MVVRITRTNSDASTVLRVDGLLQAADVDALHREYRTASGHVTLELSELRSADSHGVEAIHELVSLGARLRGLSPYLELLLGTSRATAFPCASGTYRPPAFATVSLDDPHPPPQTTSTADPRPANRPA